MIALVLAAFWPLASIHCNLEVLPQVEIASCCEGEKAPPRQACESDGCDVVESGLYKIEESPSVPPQPETVLPFLPALLVTQTAHDRAEKDSLDASPPELPKVWRVTFRVALPPRAPSFVS